MPAPPARIFSANVPWGRSSTSSSPDRNWRSNRSFSPTYVAIILRICRVFRRRPIRALAALGPRHLETRLPETVQSGVQILHLETEVVDSLAALLEKAGQGRAASGRLDQLDARPAGGEHRHAHPLARDLFDAEKVEPEHVA